MHEHPAKHWWERLRRAKGERDAALEAIREKDDFLAELSHELRSPLHVMSCWLELLRSGTLDAAMRQRALDVLERNVGAASLLVEDLLDAARLAAGKLAVGTAPVDLAAVVRDAVEDHAPAAELRGVALRGPPYDVPLLVHGDARLLARVVANLLTNALKFTAEGGCVRLSLSTDEQCAVLEVCDTGDGIAPELLPHLFDRFRQGPLRDGQPQHGLGLGLAIAKNLVERQGGSIRAESESEGRGAVFRVSLPRP